ncbi:MAG: hypothetical protein ACE5OP_11335 [Candidatus Glassbacteria bacterium]
MTFNKGFDLRQTSTYEIHADFDSDVVKDLVERAESFVTEVEKILKV